jgi:hypothetical protein
MAKLYREDLLGEMPVESLISLDSIRPASDNAAPPAQNRKDRPHRGQPFCLSATILSSSRSLPLKIKAARLLPK